MAFTGTPLVSTNDFTGLPVVSPRRRHCASVRPARGITRLSAGPSPETAASPARTTPVERPPIEDGPFARLAIAVFRTVMKPHIGWESPRNGYAGMVEECRMLLGKKTPSEQKEIVLKVLSTMFVSPRGPRLFREQFGDKPGVNALITPIFFQWLVGPSAVNDSPETDAKRTGVLIEKCRFLDESGCKGLCLNMCQQPTQAFFTDQLGLPLRMTPNFETKECQMTFGLAPLDPAADPAFQGGCIEGCKMAGSFKPDRSQVADATPTCYAQAATSRDLETIPMSASAKE